VAVQFSLSYDANGDPVLVENTVTGTRKVVSTSPVISEFKSRFATPDSGDPATDAEENQPDSNQGTIYDYINEMESGAADDINLSFVEKKNLQAYTPEAIEARSKIEEGKESMGSKVLRTMLNFIPMGSGASLIKAMAKFLPEESPEIKAVKQYYADPETAALVESIPGMSNYNIVYGNPFDPSYGLAGAAQKRIDRINKTLMKKDSSVLRDRRDKLQELIDKEEAAKLEQQYKTTASEEIRERTTNIGDVTKQQQRQANRDARAIERAYDRDTGDSYSGSYDASDDTSYSDPFDPGGGE